MGDTVVTSGDADIKPGNCLRLSDIPLGTVVHNIELKPGKGAQLARSAGCSTQLIAKEGKHAILRLPSSEMRMVPIELQSHHWSGGQHRPRKQVPGQSRDGAAGWDVVLMFEVWP